MLRIKANGRLADQFPLFFDDFFTGDAFRNRAAIPSLTKTSIPAANIKETPEHYELELAAPGMNKTDFKIQLAGQQLTVASEKQDAGDDNEESKYVNREFSYQSFRRTFTLANDVVDTENIAARYENGVLRLLVPKKETAKQKAPRLIEIA